GAPPAPPDAGTDTDIGTDYVPTTQPGHRMPHLWLTPDRSTLDALGEWFTVLTPDRAHWEQQAAADGVAWPVHFETLAPEHAGACGLCPRGALLIRPDGYIGARWSDHVPGEPGLWHALAAITSSTAGRYPVV
ncbi:hypothetical protein ACQRUO_39745, partial [Kitasatospora sp. LaBMicrA B282]